MFIGSLRCLSICEQDVYKWVKREREAAERAFGIKEKESAVISVFMLTVVKTSTAWGR